MAQVRPAAVLRVRPGWRDLLALCKLRVVSVLLVSALAGLLLARPELPPPERVVAAMSGIGLLASAGGGAQSSGGSGAGCSNGTHPAPSVAGGTGYPFAGAVLRGVSGLCGNADSHLLGQPPDRLADPVGPGGLCPDLQLLAEMGHSAEYRHRRAGRGHAAAVGMGVGQWPGGARRAPAGGHRICLDAPPISGPCVCTSGRTTPAPGCRFCPSPMATTLLGCRFCSMAGCCCWFLSFLFCRAAPAGSICWGWG